MVTATLRATTRGTVRRFEVTADAPVTLGRSSASTIAIDDAALSRQHCRIEFDQGRLFAVDLASSNGMWLGQQRVERALLAIGSVVRCGSTEIVLERIAGAKVAAQPTVPALAPEPVAPPAPEGKDLIGTELGGYRILGILGTGGAAIVYRAEQIQLGREVALKVLRQSEGGVRKEQIDAFVREARNAAKLNDPRLVQVYDVGADKGYHFLSMELVHGGSLARVLRASGPMPWAKAMPILRDIAAALHATHSAGLIHRDVKPANILLTRSGGAKLADLGLAAGDTHAGTIAFIAPEQLRSSEVDVRADLYALGCTAYTILCGAPPFQGSRREMADAHLNLDPPDFRSQGLLVPEALARLVLERLMAKDPAARPDSAEHVVDELDRIAAGTTSSTADTDALPVLDEEPAAEQASEPEALVESEPAAEADDAAPTPSPRRSKRAPSPRSFEPREKSDPMVTWLVIATLLAVIGFTIIYFL